MHSIITRFAPSPTGNLHIGGVRTALINYVVTSQAKIKNPKSKFLLRIEDTDKNRSNLDFQNTITEGLKWLGINYDGDPYIQSLKIERHRDIAFNLLKNNKAFKCICTTEILEKIRSENKNNKINDKRLCKKCETDTNIQNLDKNFTIRIKIPKNGDTAIDDLIQGKVKVANKEIDEFVILRGDGTPTYMLSSVVDDFDMGVNLIIRGDDHLNNLFRQNFIYINMDWATPNYAHLPLIHGEDGKKLSKRHGAVNINDFKSNGYLKESIINNLILLGWSPPESNELIEIDQIIKNFNLKKFSKSSSIFNYSKLNFFNNFYMKNEKNLINFNEYCNFNVKLKKLFNMDKEKILKLFNVYKKNLNNYKELENICEVYFDHNFDIIKKKLFDKNFDILIKDFILILDSILVWSRENLENSIKNFISDKKIKFIKFGKPLRIILINSENGPSISDILYILDKKNSIMRLKNYISNK